MSKKQKLNAIYYQQAWDSHEDKRCQECGIELPFFSPSFISHILSRGSSPFASYNLLNHFLLCLPCHQRWEFADRKHMGIYEESQEIKNKLIYEHYNKDKSDREATDDTER